MRSDFAEQTPTWTPPTHAAPSSIPAKPAGAALGRRLRDADLREVFASVGFASQMRELGGVTARAKLMIFDHRGGVLADLKLLHFADFASDTLRDRIEFSGLPSVERVYGREGAAVFVEKYGMAWQPLEARAKQELEVFGLLLRAPWIFASGHDFIVSPKERIAVKGNRGRERVRIRVKRRVYFAAGKIGAEKPVDQYDLICDPTSMLPREIHMTPAATGARVVVKLDDYTLYGGTSVPLRRSFIGASGRKVMELRIERFEVRQALPNELFRPRR